MLAYYYINKLCDYVFTTDSDMIGYGVSYINKINDSAFHFVNYEKTLQKFQINSDKFQFMCVLLGTDYNLSIPDCGEKTVVYYVQNFAIEEITDMIQKGHLKKILKNKITKTNIKSNINDYNELKIQFNLDMFNLRNFITTELW